MLLKDLQKLGFSKNLSSVYLTLFELGESRAGDIIRKTGLHRNLVYTALDKLEDKKLVTKSQIRGVARYSALDPTRILGEVEEKQRLAEQIIEELKAKHEVKSQEVVIYEGKSEIQKKYKELYSTLNKDDEWYILGLSEKYFEVNKKQLKEFMALQNKRKIKIKGISGYLDKNEDGYIKATPGLTEFKIVPAISKKDTEISIIKDRVIIVIFTEPYTVVEIFNQDLVDGYREYFEFLWSDTTQNLRGEEGVKIFFDDIAQYDEIHWIGGSKDGMDKYFPELAKQCKKTRLKKNITWYDLLDPEGELTGVQTGTSLNDEPNYHYKYLSESMASPHVIGIYGNKVANIIWKDGGFINIIENEEIAKGYKKQFDYLWNQEVKTYSGWEEINNLFNNVILNSLEKDDTEYVIGAGYGEETTRDNVADLFKVHNAYLVKNKIPKRVLMYEKYRKRFEQDVHEAGDMDLHYIQTRYLPDTYDSSVEIHVFNKQAIVTYFGEKPVATHYTHPKIVENYRKYFDYLWRQEVKTYVGWDEVQRFYFDVLLEQNKNHTNHVIGGGYGESGDDERVRAFYNEYAKARTEAKTKSEILFYEHHKLEAKRGMKQGGDSFLQYSKLKFLPKEHYSPLQIFVCGDIAAVVLWGEIPVVTVYEKKEMIDGFKKQFDVLWGIANT